MKAFSITFYTVYHLKDGTLCVGVWPSFSIRSSSSFVSGVAPAVVRVCVCGGGVQCTGTVSRILLPNEDRKMWLWHLRSTCMHAAPSKLSGIDWQNTVLHRDAK